MVDQPPIIEYTCFMNWMQNHSPALYTQYWAVIEPSACNRTVVINASVTNMAVMNKIEQLTGDYLNHLRSMD